MAMTKVGVAGFLLALTMEIGTSAQLRMCSCHDEPRWDRGPRSCARYIDKTFSAQRGEI